MHAFLIRAAVSAASLIVATLCLADDPALSSAGYGPNPTLPAPKRHLIPTVDIAPAVGWPAGAAPRPAVGFSVNALVSGLDHPRWIHVLPNGDVLVAETNAPPRPEE